MDVPVILSTSYFGPVSWYARYLTANTPMIEAHENYQRQSYRNRCRILGSNGVVNLIVPVEHGHRPGQPIREIQIDYRSRWQKVHQRTLMSAYRHAPYYQFYMDEIDQFWSRRWDFLYDLNLESTIKLLNLLGLKSPVQLTSSYLNGEMEVSDLREQIHPKKAHPDPGFQPPLYYQVFSDRHAFVPDLSIMDLLFCLGPDANAYLNSCLPVRI